LIAVDTNILVYAHRNEYEFHLRAKELIVSLAVAPDEWAIPWPCIHELFSNVTNPRVYKVPTPSADALDQIDAWLESPTLVLLSESPAHWSRLRNQIAKGRIAGPRVHDARIAAICLDHGVSELWSADRDFGRFPDLKVVNPLTR
jgi:hypothetical protein